MSEGNEMTLQERLLAAGYHPHWPAASRLDYELGRSASIRVTCHMDGQVRILVLDCQMTPLWTASFGPAVDDALIVDILAATEQRMQSALQLETS